MIAPAAEIHDTLASLSRGIHPIALTLLVLVIASASLGWIPSLSQVGFAGECSMLGIAQLFGGLLLLSPCTFRTGAIWSTAVFGITTVAAVALGVWWMAALASVVAVFGYGFAVRPTAPDPRP